MGRALGRSVVGLALVAVSLAPSALAAPARAAEVVKLGDVPAISSAGLYIAIDKGYFAEHGLRVDLEPFASGAKQMAGLATGQLDVAAGSPSAGLYNSIASGMEFKIVADKGQARPGASFTPLIVRKDLVDSGRVKAVRDLKGMKVAIAAKGINLDYFLARTLEHDGLGYGSVEEVNLAYPETIKALASKAIDAVMAPEPWGVRAEEQKVGQRMFLTEQVPSIATFQVAVIMYSGKFIKERPKAARDFMQAYVRGIRYFNARGLKDPEIGAIISKFTKVPAEIIRATIPAYLDNNGRPRVGDLATLQDFFHQMGWVKEKVAVERFIDLSFLE